jgi:hypothetical protein
MRCCVGSRRPGMPQNATGVDKPEEAAAGRARGWETLQISEAVACLADCWRAVREDERMASIQACRKMPQIVRSARPQVTRVQSGGSEGCVNTCAAAFSAGRRARMCADRAGNDEPRSLCHRQYRPGVLVMPGVGGRGVAQVGKSWRVLASGGWRWRDSGRDATVRDLLLGPRAAATVEEAVGQRLGVVVDVGVAREAPRGVATLRQGGVGRDELVAVDAPWAVNQRMQSIVAETLCL